MAKRPIGYFRELRAKRDRIAFKTLIATPAVGAFTMPANAQVRLLSVAGCAAGTTAGSHGGTDFKTPELAAGGYIDIGQVERDVELTPASGFDVLIHNGLGRYAKVAEGA